MIIKFDHVAFSCTREVAADLPRFVKENYQGYHTVFEESGIPNLPIKNHFLSPWQEEHDLALLESDGGQPVEITAYPELAGQKGHYDLREKEIWVYTGDPRQSMEFYQAIGFMALLDGSLEWKLPLSPLPLRLVLKETGDRAPSCDGPCLNAMGYCCLAFVSNRAMKERDRLIQAGLAVTEITELTLHQRKMKLFFAYNQRGDICEILSMEK